MSIGISNLPSGPHEVRWLAGLSYGRTIRDSSLWVCVSRIGSAGLVRGCPELVELPVAALPYLRIGFVWNNHAPTDDLQAKCVRANLSNLRVPPDGAKFVRIFTEPCNDLRGKPLASGSECVLKPGNHPLPPEAQGAWAVRLENVRFNNQSNAARVLVPCLELLRFYFCTSSYLTDQLVQFGLFDPTMLYSEARPETPTEPAYIRLVNRLASTDVPVIARIAFDPAAAREAKRVGASLRAGAESNPGAACCFSKMGFPFNGRTEISCVGRWVMTHEGFAFLVLSLLRCSARFPFQRLEFSGPGDSGPRTVGSTLDLVSTEGALEVPATGPAQQKHVLVDGQAIGLPETNSFAREETGSRFGSPFVVQRVRVGKTDSGSNEPAQTTTSSKPTPASVGAAGLVGIPPSTSANACPGIRHISSMTIPSDAPGSFDPDLVMENFINATNALESRARGSHAITTTAAPCGDITNATFTEFSTALVGPWAVLGSMGDDDPRRAGNSRLAYVLAVECAKRHCFFIEIDRLRREAGMHTRVVYRRDGKEIPRSIISKLMQILYRARGGDLKDLMDSNDSKELNVLKEVEGVVIRNFEHSSYGISKETSATKSAHSKAAHPTKTKISAKQAAHLTAEKMFKWLKAELRRTARYFHTDVCSSPE